MTEALQDSMCELYTRFIEDRKTMSEIQALESIENIIATLLSTEVIIDNISDIWIGTK